jgi:hypothetical protein
MAAALGIDAPLGHTFRCVIHDDTQPSAALYQAPQTGHWLYHDFHAPAYGDPEWLNLAQVRARRATRNGELSSVELATWKLILLVEARLLPLVPVPAAPPAPTLSADAQHVYKWFLFLLGCRWHYTHGAPAPFSRTFASCLTGLSEKRTSAAIKELTRCEQICVAERQGRLRLWLPAGVKSTAERTP